MVYYRTDLLTLICCQDSGVTSSTWLTESTTPLSSRCRSIRRSVGSYKIYSCMNGKSLGRLRCLLADESRIIEHINKFQGVEWCTFAEMAEEFKAGRIEGHVVET